ncbi:monophosphatase [Mycobacterium tuberculosis]|nr:monophosphatase [Mycobacterium tuberculosis]
MAEGAVDIAAEPQVSVWDLARGANGLLHDEVLTRLNAG